MAAVYLFVIRTRLSRLLPLPPRRRGRRARLLTVFAALFLLAATASPRSLLAQLNSIKVLDTTALVPPPGARVAIVEFDDLECPTCARFNPLLKQAAANYRIPWIRHDFLIPYHNWSRSAAVYARWFDAKSKALGDEYRDQVFAYVAQEDSPRPLMFQLDLLRSVGFREVEILHKNSCFAAFGAIKYGQ